MKGALSLDMLRRSDMTVLERRRSWQRQQEQRFRTRFTCGGPDPELENGWSDVEIHHQLPGLVFGSLDGSSSSNDSISTTSPAMAAAAENSSGQENVSSGGFKKRKAHHLQNAKAVVEEHNLEESMEADSKVTEENSKKNCCISRKSVKKEAATKVEFEKPDYIHVRARRGQATDSHSLAERLRREKISERMRYLQGLVPGCATITGKAGMLDEIINYVQSLQHQVEFLSMKLATVNPSLEYNNTGNFFMKEITHASSPSFQMCGIFSETPNSACLQTDASQQVGSSCGLDFEMNSPDTGLRSLSCAPLSVPADTFFDSSRLAQTQPSTSWDAELQSLYIMAFDQGRAM